MQYPLFASYRPSISLLATLLFLLTLAASVCGQVRPDRSISDERRNNTGDQNPSSLLVYNFYTSDAANSTQQDTRLTLTNTDRTTSVNVHIFFITAGCSLADGYFCLTGNQTVSLQTSAYDPGATGYIIALAVNAAGCPISFNRLIGSASVKLPTGATASFNAEGFSALYAGTLPGCASNDVLAVVRLDGKIYTAPAGRLAIDSIPSAADGNTTTLIVNSLQGNLLTGATAIGELSGVLYNDTEDAFSFTLPANACQLNRPLTNTFPLTTPRFMQAIPSERSGWLQIFSTTNKAISGAVINYNASVQGAKGAFNTSHNLHHLSPTTSSITIPVFPPTC